MSLLMLSTALDYAYGFWVASPNRKKAKLFLWFSILNNLGILAVFKYYNFFALQFKEGLELLGFQTHPVLLQVALPIGISFYTFHGMSYVFDIYRGNQKPVKNFIDYAVFVSFFPLLVAGPIERANHLLPQVQKPRFFNYNQTIQGLRLVLWGLFKKVIIADTLANTVNEIFENPINFNSYSLVIATISFSFQIYCDFSGYSDIAIGTAKLFGFELLSNFKFPYFSRNIGEFWRRWHISLSSWFRDYLYIPLGGSKNGLLISIRNTFVIFIISGFWHGASWNFIVWGLIHACLFLPSLLLGKNRKYVNNIIAQDKKWPNIKEIFQILLTFMFVSFAWIFFRAPNLNSAFFFIKRILSDCFINPTQFLTLPREKTAILLIIIMIILDWWFRKDHRDLRIIKYKPIQWGIYITIIILLIRNLAQSDESGSFIYFQF